MKCIDSSRCEQQKWWKQQQQPNTGSTKRNECVLCLNLQFEIVYHWNRESNDSTDSIWIKMHIHLLSIDIHLIHFFFQVRILCDSKWFLIALFSLFTSLPRASIYFNRSLFVLFFFFASISWNNNIVSAATQSISQLLIVITLFAS